MKEIDEIKDISLLDIVSYIKNSIDVIVNFKVEDLMDEYKSKKDDNAAEDYEILLQKEEAAIRQHISYEHEMKIEYEKLLEKIEIMELENKLLVFQIVSIIYIIYFIYIILQEKNKGEYDEKIESLKKELNDTKINIKKVENKYKEQLNAKDKEIVKLQTKIKVLNNTLTHKNDNFNNSTLKSKANSTIYTISKDDFENSNKYKSEELYSLYKDNNNNDNFLSYKNRTMSNINPSRNTNYFTIVNRCSNKNRNNISMQCTMAKNFSTNSLRKTKSSIKKNQNLVNSSRKKKNLKQNIYNNNSLNITNNTYNMNKNNIMINLNPKNVNVNIEKLKVQKKLYEYQRLIDQKLNELIKNRHPHMKRGSKGSFHIRRNSSPDIYIKNNMSNNSQRKQNSSVYGLEYYLKKSKKKSITPNTNTNKKKEMDSNIARKIISSSTIDFMKKRKNSQRNNSKRQNIKKNKNISDNAINLKQNLNNTGFNSKIKEINNCSKLDNDSTILNGKSNLSLRKYIFAKCNPASDGIKN